MATKKIHTIVIAPSTVAGRVVLRTYQDGQMRMQVLPGDNIESIMSSVLFQLRAMGIPDSPEDAALRRVEKLGRK